MITKFISKLFSFSVLLGFGVYISQLFSANKLFYYIHERFFGGIQVAFLLSIFIATSFLLLGLIYLFLKKKKTQVLKEFLQETMDVKVISILLLIFLSITIAPIFILFSVLIILAPIKGSKFNLILNKLSFGNIIIVLIMILGFLIPPKPLSSDIASQRENSYSTYTNIENKVTAIGNFNTSTVNYDVKDWLNSLNYNPDLEYYKNKEVGLVGFIYIPQSKNYGANNFMISRFIVSCCAVDAVPVGLKVKYDFKKDFVESDWIKIHGKFDIIGGELIIVPDKVEKIEIPDNPYLYL